MIQARTIATLLTGALLGAAGGYTAGAQPWEDTPTSTVERVEYRDSDPCRGAPDRTVCEFQQWKARNP